MSQPRQHSAPVTRAMLDEMLDEAFVELRDIAQRLHRLRRRLRLDSESVGALHCSITEVLREHGSPMTATEVLSALQAKGVVITGRHQRETVRSALVRKPHLFTRINVGLFVLASQPGFASLPLPNKPTKVCL